MKARSAAVQGALAVAGLLAAYLTWQRPPEQSDGKVVVLRASKGEVRQIRFEDERRIVEVLPEQKGAVWIRQTDKVTAPAAEPAESPLIPPPRPREFRGNEAALKLLERFAPLQATRGLGVLAQEKLEEVGLANSRRTLEVQTAAGKGTFTLSNAALGGSAPWLRDEHDGRVYLVAGSLLSDLEFANTRLIDRRLHTFADADFDAWVITAEGRERRLARTAERWADAADGALDEFASNWHDRLWRLAGVEVLGRGESPEAGEPQLALRVDYLHRGRSVGFTEVGTAGKDAFARTEHSAGWVRLAGGAEQLLRERDQVLQGGR
jgi:hypothetical protein